MIKIQKNKTRKEIVMDATTERVQNLKFMNREMTKSGYKIYEAWHEVIPNVRNLEQIASNEEQYKMVCRFYNYLCNSSGKTGEKGKKVGSE